MGITDSGWRYCGWNIDDIEIWGIPPKLAITSIETTGNDITVNWSATPGKSYTVQWSTNLVDWTDVSVGQADTWTDTDVSETNKFYRVIEN